MHYVIIVGWTELTLPLHFVRCCTLVVIWRSCVLQQAEKKRTELLRFPDEMTTLEDATKW